MKIEITQKELQKHINIAQKAISSRTAIQILEGILFVAKDNYLKLTSTDLELSVETKVPCIVEQEGSIVINSSMIGNIVRKLPDAPVTINTVGESIQIKCLQSEFNLIGQDPVDYPHLPDKNEETKLTLKEEVLKDAIKQTVFAASIDETRPALTGVLFKAAEKSMDFVALDGFRISLRNINLDKEYNEIKEIIPARALNELQKILDGSEDINISFVPGHVIFEVRDTLVYSRLLEGKFINYSDIISFDYETKVVVDKKLLQSSLERASLLASVEKANLVKLNVKDGNIHISSNSEIGSVNENVICDKTGEDLEIAFNARYILDGLKIIDSEKCELLFTGSLNPCIIRPIDDDINYTYLVLPVRLARN